MAILKAECKLRGIDVTIKNWGQWIRVRPCKSAQFWEEGASYPVFQARALEIVREEAVALGFTHVRGLPIDPNRGECVIGEELHF